MMKLLAWDQMAKFWFGLIVFSKNQLVKRSI